MLNVLAQIKKELPELLIDEDFWNGLYIDYHLPVVERLWRQWGYYRIYLHWIHPCDPEDSLFHPYPWPSAMEIISGRYEMLVGYGEGSEAPPVAARIILPEGSSYEMTNMNAWHSVRPLNVSATSIMVTGKPWDRWSPSGEKKPGPLNEKSKEQLLDHFRHHLGYKLNHLSHDIRDVARFHTKQTLDNYASVAHVAKCRHCQASLDEIYRGRYLKVGNIHL